MLKSVICRQEHFRTDWYEMFAAQMNLQLPEHVTLHRKNWEFCAIAQTLLERGKLRSGSKGLGFAVGRERLVSLLASYGVTIEATDLSPDAPDSEIWKNTSQHASALEHLHYPEIIDLAAFHDRVQFHPADMRDLASFPSDEYDFVWSSCAMEHLGNLERGLDFVFKAMRLLKPGGIAVHTTEINVASDEETVETGDAVVYRPRDLRELDQRLRREGMCLEELDLFPGSEIWDRRFDRVPYYRPGTQHIKLEILGHVSTSTLLICYK